MPKGKQIFGRVSQLLRELETINRHINFDYLSNEDKYTLAIRRDEIKEELG